MTPTDLDLALRHRYRTMSGQMAVNVTRITGLLDDDGKSSRMAGAAARLTREGKNYRKEWDEARDRGTRLHTACEAWLRNEDAEVLPEDEAHLDGLEHFFDDSKAEPVAIERVVLSEYGFGGRFDFVARFDGIDTLVDVKSGRRHPLEHCLQLAAYRHADGMAVYTDEGKLARLEPLPRIERAGCLYLDPTLERGYEFVELPADIDAFDLFLAILDVYHGLEEIKERLK